MIKDTTNYFFFVFFIEHISHPVQTDSDYLFRIGCKYITFIKHTHTRRTRTHKHKHKHTLFISPPHKTVQLQNCVSMWIAEPHILNVECWKKNQKLRSVRTMSKMYNLVGMQTLWVCVRPKVPARLFVRNKCASPQTPITEHGPNTAVIRQFARLPQIPAAHRSSRAVFFCHFIKHARRPVREAEQTESVSAVCGCRRQETCGPDEGGKKQYTPISVRPESSQSKIIIACKLVAGVLRARPRFCCPKYAFVYRAREERQGGASNHGKNLHDFPVGTRARYANGSRTNLHWHIGETRGRNCGHNKCARKSREMVF